jgi:ubiquinone/menaquinone biosynthesis C-methylase UbiE
MDVKRRIKEYWDNRGESYDRSPGHVCLPDVWRKVLSEVFDGKMRILDVGTGTGFLALILAELGHEVVGLDLSEGMLRVARKKAEQRGLKIQFKLGDAENLPFKDESFDAVICRHLIWTLPNPKSALEEWARVARRKVIVIDGKWMDSSISTRVRKFFSRILIGIYERRNPFRYFHYRKDINKVLPFYGGAELRVLLDMFESAGLNPNVRDLMWIREMQMRDMPFVYRIAWTKRDYFMIEGVKSQD